MGKKKSLQSVVSLDDLAIERLSKTTLRDIKQFDIASIETVHDEDGEDHNEDSPSLHTSLKLSDGRIKVKFRGQFSSRKFIAILAGSSGLIFLTTNVEVFEYLRLFLLSLLK